MEKLSVKQEFMKSGQARAEKTTARQKETEPLAAHTRSTVESKIARQQLNGMMMQHCNSPAADMGLLAAAFLRALSSTSLSLLSPVCDTSKGL